VVPASWGGRYYEDIRNVNEILRNAGKQLANRDGFLRRTSGTAEGEEANRFGVELT
jgi:hypothetical protein